VTEIDFAYFNCDGGADVTDSTFNLNHAADGGAIAANPLGRWPP
jgi:predicted outer membrane repeat protein